jgi:SAM-dependent methyltransferase
MLRFQDMKIDDLERSLRAFQESRILLTAIELNIFTIVAGGASASMVAERIPADARATRCLLDALVALNALRKSGTLYENEHWASELLDDSSPHCERPALLHLAHRWHTWSQLTDRIRGAVAAEEHRALDHNRHEALLAMLHRRSTARAPLITNAVGSAGVFRILDLGGGSAAYSLAFAQSNDALQADVLDLPPMIPITQRYIREAGLADRVKAHAADILVDSFGSGYDLVLLCSVLHLFGEVEIQDILARCHEALRAGGRIVIHDHLLEEDKTAPKAGAIFALNMLLATANGGTYSKREYCAWLQAAGFHAIEQLPMPGPTGLLVATC